MAAPYGLLINGTTKLEATPLSNKDYQGREQYLVDCVELSSGDYVQICDFGNNDATWMSNIDPYGAYQQFTGGKTQGKITCNLTGTYDFYIKLKYEDDLLYIGTSQNCTNETPDTPDSPIIPDGPTKTIYLNTGGSGLWNTDGAKVFVHSWDATAHIDLQMT